MIENVHIIHTYGRVYTRLNAAQFRPCCPMAVLFTSKHFVRSSFLSLVRRVLLYAKYRSVEACPHIWSLLTGKRCNDKWFIVFWRTIVLVWLTGCVIRVGSFQSATIRVVPFPASPIYVIPFQPFDSFADITRRSWKIRDVRRNYEICLLV